MQRKATCLSEAADFAIYAHAHDKLSIGDIQQRWNDSGNYFRISSKNEDAFELGKSLYNRYKGTPMTGMSLKLYWDYYLNSDSKSEFDMVLLLSFLALKSIVGDKPYVKTDNKFWWNRMSGNAKSSDLKFIDKALKKYHKEYWAVKIKMKLEENWGLVTYARYTKGFYASSKMSLDDLVYEVEKKRVKNQSNDFKEKRENAYQNALNKLKSEN